MNVSDSPIADPIAVAAKRLSVSRAFLYVEIKAGRLISLKAGARTLISRAEQTRWLAALPQSQVSL